jgi:hypothetical protein
MKLTASYVDKTLKTVYWRELQSEALFVGMFLECVIAAVLGVIMERMFLFGVFSVFEVNIVVTVACHCSI